MAVTFTVPLPRAVTSAVVSTTATVCEPVVPARVRVLMTSPEVPLKVTVTVEAASAVTRTTPEAWMASARVAPVETPVPRAMDGLLGLTVSTR